MFIREVFILIYDSLNSIVQENKWKNVKIIPILDIQIRARLENKYYPRKTKLFLKWLNFNKSLYYLQKPSSYREMSS